MKNIFLSMGVCALAEVAPICDLYANIGVRPDSTPYTRSGDVIPLNSRPDTYIPANSYAANYKPPSQPITMSVAETYCTCPTSHYYYYKDSTTDEDVYYKDNMFCAAGGGNDGMGCIYYASGEDYVPCGYQMQAAICAPKACPPISSNGYTYHYQVAVDSGPYTYDYSGGGSTSGTNYWTYCKPYSAERNLVASKREKDDKVTAPSTGTALPGKQYRDQLKNDKNQLEDDNKQLHSHPLQTDHGDIETDMKTLRTDRQDIRKTRQDNMQTGTSGQEIVETDIKDNQPTHYNEEQTRENLNATFHNGQETIQDGPATLRSSAQGTLDNAYDTRQNAQQLHQSQLKTLENLQTLQSHQAVPE